MNEKTEQLKKMAQEKLSDVFGYIEKAKSELEECLDKCAEDVEKMVGQLKDELTEKKHQADENKTKLEKTLKKQKETIGAKYSKIKEKVESKKEDKIKKRILVKAEKAERRAELCMDYASVAVVEAELACLEAAAARHKADEVLGSKQTTDTQQDTQSEG